MVGITKISIVALLIILTTGHLEAQQNQVYNINLSGKEKKAEKVNISTIASDIDYIALETNTNSYITRIYKIIKTEKNLLILDDTNMKRERLMVFDLDGSFMTLINEVGQGPGEYIGIQDFAFDPKNQLITILDASQKKLLQFSLSGEFIRELKLDFRPFKICFIEPGYFILTIPLRFIEPEQDGKLYNTILCDLDLKVKKRIPSPIEYLENPNSPFVNTGGLGVYNHQLRLKQPFTDKIYTLDKELQYRLYCNFSMGKYKMPESVSSSIESSRKRSENYKSISGNVESRDYYFIKYRYKRIPYTYMYRKSDGMMTSLSSKWGNNGFINDFDGSMDFWPKLSTGPDEIIAFYNAIDVIDYFDKNNVKKFKSKFPKQQNKFLDLMNKIDEESNPVIQLITLKK